MSRELRGKIVIPSYSRSAQVRKHVLLPHAWVLVPERQRAEYEAAIGGLCQGIVTHPDSLRGIANARQYLIEQYWDEDEDFIFQSDDDIVTVFDMNHAVPRRVRNADWILAIVRHNAQLALDAGAASFGFGYSQNPRDFTSQRPFRLRAWTSGYALGLTAHARRFGMAFDTTLSICEDPDICLQSIEHTGLSWRDERFVFRPSGIEEGGNADFETGQQRLRYTQRFVDKWGPAIVVQTDPVDGTRFVVNTGTEAEGWRRHAYRGPRVADPQGADPQGADPQVDS